MYYRGSFDKLETNNSDPSIDKSKRQVRVRCYTCKVNQRGRDGICKNLANNTCPHGYQNELKVKGKFTNER